MIHMISYSGQSVQAGVSIDVMINATKSEAKKNPNATLDDLPWCGLLEWRAGAGSATITHADGTQEVCEFPKGKLSVAKKTIQLKSGDNLFVQSEGGKEFTIAVDGSSWEAAPGTARPLLPTDERADDTEDQKAVRKWLREANTGVSSKTMAHVLYGVPEGHDDYDGPHDPADFHRCMTFLEYVPQARPRVSELANINGWEKLAPAFDELEALYKEEKGQRSMPKLYEKIKEMREANTRRFKP